MSQIKKWKAMDLGNGFGYSLVLQGATSEQAEAALQAIAERDRYKSQVERMLAECAAIIKRNEPTDDYSAGCINTAASIRAAANRSESE